MPASNISQIRAGSDAANTAIEAQIAAYGVTAFQPKNKEDHPDSYALTLFARGPSRGLLKRTPVGGLEPHLWPESTVSIELFVPRVTNDPATIAGVYDRLGENAVRVDHALAPDRLAALNARLPYHHLTRLEFLGEVVGYDEERKCDRHELRYRTCLGVLPTAWPTDPDAYVLAA